ncbi:sulfatase [Pelagicoccus sp. NFK12]|uniref:Sulfatase n=2 Tax=Pelagicoccus enzymogenes TaxID=2773457 RepID=A0A927F7W8_9BACT|nr:sulfatase [Pelagicoccus enzymogenes]
MADDLGWADVGYQGAEFYETPNIDSLSASGMTFSDGYPGAANCLPSRSCIISGMYTPRTKMYQPGRVAKGPAELMKLLVPNQKDAKGDGTIESTTHLDPSTESLARILKAAGYQAIHLGKWHLGSTGQGFDINDLDGRGAGLEMDNRLYGDKDVAEWITDAAIGHIKDSAANDNEDPFFLYINHWDVHVPINARAAVVKKYQNKLGAKEWSRDWDPVYAAMIEAVDTSVGRIRKALDASGLSENTLIVFTSDNGGHAGATWNDPLKGSKGSFYEGGIRVPLIMSWPGKIEPGSVCQTPVTGVDYMPTFAELAGAALPSSQPVDGVSLVPLMKGDPIPERSIFWHYPLYLNSRLQVKPVFGTERMYWRTTPCSVVRTGDWKLMQFFESDALELYNVREDIGEQNNLAAQYPERVERMLGTLQSWQRETNADIPTTLNPSFDPNFNTR